MALKVISILVLLHIGIGVKNVHGSPFELVDEYIEKFTNQLDHLRTYLNVRSHLEHKEEDYLFTEDHKKDIGEFDFIIVGAGSSGSVIANRLSEIPEWKILLLDAGPVETKETKVPSMHPCLKTASSPFTWGYYSTPQNHSCLDMEERRCYIPTAKVIGGTTAINDMLYTRGNQRDFDLWADTGLKGWCWESLYPYFKRIEDAHLESKMDHKFHHYGGPVYLESPRHPSEIAHSFLEGGKEIGLDEIDINGKSSLGLGIPHLMTKCGQRYSAADAYLQPTLKRKNIETRYLSEVTKIIISEHTKESRGVEFMQHDHIFTASATKEIILAGGAINSAKLLLLSGIGPKEDLEHLKIHPIMDLKVGHTLYDHISFPGLSYVFNHSDNIDPIFFYSKEIDYLRNGRGPLTSPGVDLVGFIKTEYSKGRFIYPDVGLIVTSNKFEARPPKIQERLDGEEKKEIEHRGFTINLVLLHPKSQGQLKLKDSDPLHHPLIDLNALSDDNDDDIETILSAIRFTQKLIDTHPMQHLNMHLRKDQAPQCEHYKLDSDDYWRCTIRHLSYSLGHVTGTAPMGFEKDGHYADSVVDSNLRVHGVEKLRVADDSVVPVSISGNLPAVKMVIGEKCADLIKGEWVK